MLFLFLFRAAFYKRGAVVEGTVEFTCNLFRCISQKYPALILCQQNIIHREKNNLILLLGT